MSWPLPDDEEFRRNYTKRDIPKMLRSRIIGKFTGHASDYSRFKAAFFPHVHVQREPAHIKAAALDALLELEVRERVFGTGLGTTEADYVERLERLERKFGGEERLIEYSLNKIKGLRELSRRDYEKFEELVDAIYFFVKGVGKGDANSLSLREHLREGMPPGLLKRYMEKTAERKKPDTLQHMLEWSHRNIRMHFKHRDFEAMWKTKQKKEAVGAQEAQEDPKG